MGKTKRYKPQDEAGEVKAKRRAPEERGPAAPEETVIDRIIHDFAASLQEHPGIQGWGRQAQGPRQRAINNMEQVAGRIFEFLRMGKEQFSCNAPISLQKKEDAVPLLLNMLDARSEDGRIAPLEIYKFHEIKQVADYACAKNILRMLRIWDDANGKNFARQISSAESYLRIAHAQQECRKLLTRMVDSGIRGEMQLKSLLRRMVNPRPGSKLEEEIVSCVEDNAFRNAIIRGLGPSAYGGKVAKLAKPMMNEGLRLVNSSCANSQPSLKNILHKLKSWEIYADEAAQKILETHRVHGESWKKEQALHSAIRSMIMYLGTHNLTAGTKRMFVSVIRTLGQECISDAQLMREMEQAGCGIPNWQQEGFGAEQEATKPICGKRKRKLRRELGGQGEYSGREGETSWSITTAGAMLAPIYDGSPLPEKKMWVSHRKKGRGPRQTQREKRNPGRIKRNA